MPVTVVVRSASGERDPSLTFDGARIVIGRSDGSDVRLPDPSVSQRHASLRREGASLSIVDEGSANGTWVGGAKLPPHTPHPIRPGDLVRVGRVWLELAIGHEAPTPDLAAASRDLASSLVRRAMEAVGDETVATVRVAEGPDVGAELRLADEGRLYVLGRAEGCDLALADEGASREHASVVRRGGQVLLRDLGARSGVFLGDARLTPDRDVVWRPPATARLGGSILVLDDPVSAALAELEAAADEVVPEDEAPPPPASRSAPATARPASEAPPASRAAGAQKAPLTEVAHAQRAPAETARRRRRVWTSADMLVLAMAVAIIAASVAGLSWVLR